MLENIRICLNAGQAMGIKSSFQPTDLVQDQNLMAVYTFLNELAQKVQRFLCVVYFNLFFFLKL